MKIRFEEKMNNRYMVICPDRSEAGLTAYMYRMILENRIKGLVNCRTGNLDGRTMLYFNITGMVRVSEYLREHSADEDFLRRFLRELAAVIEELQRYLIGSESIILEPDQMFVSSDTGAFRFVVCFEERNSFSENLLKFSEYLIPRLPNNNHAAAAIGYELYQSCISGLVTAGSIRCIAASDITKDKEKQQIYERTEDQGLIISEDDIFKPRTERGKKKKSEERETWRKRLSQKAAAVKESVNNFLHSLTDEGP